MEMKKVIDIRIDCAGTCDYTAWLKAYGDFFMPKAQIRHDSNYELSKEFLHRKEVNQFWRNQYFKQIEKEPHIQSKLILKPVKLKLKNDIIMAKKRFDEYFAKVVLEYCFPKRFTDLQIADKPDLRCGNAIGIEVTNCMPKEAAEAFNLWHRVAKQGRANAAAHS